MGRPRNVVDRARKFLLDRTPDTRTPRYIPGDPDLRWIRGLRRRMSALDDAIERGALTMSWPAGDLLGEFRRFPCGDHDDCLDALGYLLGS